MARDLARGFPLWTIAPVLVCLLLLICACSAPLAPGGSEEVLIPEGTFQMGCSPDDGQCDDDEKPLHMVNLADYFIDRYEVTNARYAACVQAGACSEPQDKTSNRHVSYYDSPLFDGFPVVNVNWEQANAFCVWEGKRLSTEAEWEKAARGREDTRIYLWGDDAPDCARLNFNTSDAYSAYDPAKSCVGDTTEVGSYAAGASLYGVMDMAGNVWEWVNDWYGETYYQPSPGQNLAGPDTGEYRVLRGGSWDDSSGSARASNRYWYNPDNWGNDLGFRCARSP